MPTPRPLAARVRPLRSVLLLLALTAPLVAEETQPPPLTLREAVQRGLLEAAGRDPESYRSIHLDLVNPGDRPVEVDVCGSFLTPRGPRTCQRLGLGPVLTPGAARRPQPGTAVVTVEARGTLALHVATVCLDASKPCPSHQSFAPSTDALPPVRERVLRWWADNPKASQSAVNSAIWRNAPYVDTRGPEATPERRPRPFAALRGVLHGTTTYVLRAGDLVARDADGTERFLATRVHDVFPVEGALYAVAEATGGPELWRYVETGEEVWKHVARLPDDLPLVGLAALPGGGLLLAGETRLLHLAPGAASPEERFALPERAHGLSWALQRDGLRVGFTLPAQAGVFQGGQQEHAQSPRSELWRLDVTGRQPAARLRPYWNVAGIAQGAGGAFALTNAGHLRVLRGASFRDQPGPDDVQEVLHVGREHLWVRTRDDGLQIVRIDSGASVRAAAPCSALRLLRVDAPSGDAAAVRGGALVRVRAATGELQELVAPGR